MFQRSSFSIKPSEINYTCSAIGVTPQDIAREVGRMAGSAAQREMYRPPKLQVFKQTGRYFTLNNSELHLCRLLEKRGEIETVRVEMIPKHKVPKEVSALLLPRGGGQSEGGTSTEESVPTYCGKCSEQADRKSNDKVPEVPEVPEVDEDTQSVVSVSLDSDVESVDSQPDPYQCSTPESSTSASTESDLGEDMESVV